METDEATSHASRRQSPSSSDDPITVGQRIDRIGDAASMALRGSRDVVSELRGLLDIEGRVDRNPYAMMAAAAGSGYVLGGGLFSPLTARVLSLGVRLGLRLAASPLIQGELLGFARAACADGEGSGSPDSKSQDSNVANERRRYDEPERPETPR